MLDKELLKAIKLLESHGYVVAENMKPIAWGCQVCRKVDWADTTEQLAKPEHVCYRGMELGECPGRMVAMYGRLTPVRKDA